MSLFRSIRRGLAALFDRETADRDATDEVAHYVEQVTAHYIEQGLSPDDARRAARREVGDPSLVRERVRTSGWEHLVEAFVTDLRYALRRLRTEPGFTVTTVGTLALGLGGATAIFSAVHAILLAPLPYPDPDRVAMVWEVAPDGQRVHATYGMFRALEARSRSFEASAVVRAWQPTLTGTGRPERMTGQRITAGYFPVLGVSPAVGRGIADFDDVPGSGNVVVIGNATWRGRFGADSTIVGRPIMLDDVPYTVVGVMPAGFTDLLAPSAELWTALQYDMTQGRAWGHHLRMIARLASGAAPERAVTELDAIGAAVLADVAPPSYAAAVAFDVVPLADDLTAGVQAGLLAMFAAVALLLAVACVNVANLILGRAVRRRGELALRSALGAGVGRIVRQLLTESVVLAFLGGAAGLAVAAVAVRTLVGFVPAELPRADTIAIGGTAVAFAALATVVTGIVCGLIPLFVSLKGAGAQVALEQSSRRTGVGSRRARAALVVGEVALTLVLLVGSGLLFRSMQRLFAVETGFTSSGVMTVQVRLAGSRFASDSAVDRFYAEAVEAARRVPGVVAAAFTNQLPLSGDAEVFGVFPDPAVDDATVDPSQIQTIYRYAVSPGYLETMAIPVLAGRALNEGDRSDAPAVVVVSESFASSRFPGRDPIGWHVTVGANPTRYRIVGVAGDVRHESLALRPVDGVYVTLDQSPYGDPVATLVARTTGDPTALAGALRGAVWSVDSDQAVSRVVSMDGLVARSAAERRFAVVLLEAFAFTALVLAAAGLYGVLSLSVAERTREIGVRMAVGATARRIVALVVRQGAILTALGVVIGGTASVGATRAIEGMLFGVAPSDGVTYVAVIALLVVVAVLAATVPAWRAARVNPVDALTP